MAAKRTTAAGARRAAGVRPHDPAPWIARDIARYAYVRNRGSFVRMKLGNCESGEVDYGGG